MENTWNHCLLCSAQLKQGRTEGHRIVKPSQNILLQFLVRSSSIQDDNALENSLYKEILQFTSKPEDAKGRTKAFVKFCGECERTADQFMEMQLELKQIQKRIVDKLKSVMQVIIDNSRLYGKNPEVKQGFAAFKKMMEGMEKAGRDSSLEREFLVVLHRFNTAIFEADMDNLHVPLGFRFNDREEQIEGDTKTQEVQVVSKLEEVKIEEEDSVEEIGFSDEEEMEGLDKVEESIKSDSNSDEDPLENTLNDLAAGPSGCWKVVQITKDKGATGPSPKGSSVAPSANKRKRVRVSKKPRKAQVRHTHFKCELCPFTTWKECKAYQHLQEHENSNEEKTYACSKCPMKFGQQQSLKHHFYRRHSKYTRRGCDVCGTRMHVVDLETHLKTHPQMYFCKFCDFCCGTYKTLIDHISLPKGAKLNCELCIDPTGEEQNSKKSFIGSIDLAKHLHDSHGFNYLLWKCEYPNCKKEFIGQARMLNHARSHQNLYLYSCSDCDKSFKLQNLLQNHIRAVHKKEKKFQCDLCPERFLYRPTLLSHKVAQHGLEKIKCDLCPHKEFNSRVRLRAHMKTCHEGSQTQKCPKCQKDIRVSCFQGHMKMHTDKEKEAKFTCEQCGFSTIWAYCLRQHMLRHNGEKTHKCRYCSKLFLKIEYLKAHERVHTGEKPYQCEICGAAYRTSSEVYGHKKRKHEKNDSVPKTKDFTCDVCGFATNANDLLKHHMLRHSGDKKFQCSYCPKKFLVKGSLICHERVHTGEKPYKCEPCGTAYAQRIQLLLHNRRKHNAGGN